MLLDYKIKEGLVLTSEKGSDAGDMRIKLIHSCPTGMADNRWPLSGRTVMKQ